MGVSTRAGGRSPLARRSLKVMRDNQALSGAFVASPAFPVYRYSWFRDGAFIADAMSRAGERASADAFLGWCREVVIARVAAIDRLVERRQAGEAIPLSEFLHTRYTVDGREADDAWWNHQLDGYGAWVWLLGEHAARHRVDPAPFVAAVEATTRYLLAFWDHPCYDAWEEHGDRVHVSTLAAIAAALRVTSTWPGIDPILATGAVTTAERIRMRVLSDGTYDGHLVKWLGGADVDANLLFCGAAYRLFHPTEPILTATLQALRDAGLVHGGVHRHAADVFYGGGEWVLLAAMLGSHHVATGDLDAAREQLAWVEAQAGADGNLPEQVSSHLLHPEHLGEWRERWGPIAHPLLWSHAMHLRLMLELEGAG